ncbi:hypothetical protein HYH03_014798 [Edaphochlamys debaryana]|uniref:Cupin type-2 domain-containing protein n=1 Tax=Edaphochlamys debaryana TaxID=47281 RepID=A0A835XMB8_9CHLO|nr:hypothetical protein HYH03_014798 [Edaphochlamys debaryana]|eukprot:KAG2486496.1 hypothetical protein HYH03_014798 [Edaphochlamys debaryana]
MDTAHLTIFPGKGFPPHRHKEGDEMIYVLSGRMEYSYWGAGMTEPATVLLGPGDSNYIRANELHKVWNSGSEDLVMIIASQKVAPMEFFDDFPSDYNAAGALVPVLPWEGACPPGQELVKDEL